METRWSTVSVPNIVICAVAAFHVIQMTVNISKFTAHVHIHNLCFHAHAFPRQREMRTFFDGGEHSLLCPIRCKGGLCWVPDQRGNAQYSSEWWQFEEQDLAQWKCWWSQPVHKKSLTRTSTTFRTTFYTKLHKQPYRWEGGCDRNK